MSVLVPNGFVAGAVSCGIKDAGALDLAIVAVADGRAHPAAAVFTQSRAAAAPVVVSREHLVDSAGLIGGVIVSSGNANALTGEQGIADARTMAEVGARVLRVEGASSMLVCSTGLIGIPLPIERVERAEESLRAAVGGTSAHADRAARAILTTDTVTKEATYVGEGFSIGGMAKGAAMIAPNMATMLAVITTDASIDPERAHRALSAAVATTFNRITIDGCTSTNDTVVLLTSEQGADPGEEFESGLLAVARSLARQIVADAEGSSRLIDVIVTGARTEADAEEIARRIASSLLVKCSLLGSDPYWGRVLGEVGLASVPYELSRCEVRYQGITVAIHGAEARHLLTPAERGDLAEAMMRSQITLEVDLGSGRQSATIVTADIGYGYLDENVTTS
ncbi:MAG: bifunctional glutamate N-acetyltransferase/amino-acid acetyltransferase ArgJ [Ferrimicrobium sp.]